MQVEITYIENVNTGKAWKKINVSYKNLNDNKEGHKTLVSFGAEKEAFNTLSTALIGEQYNVEVYKDGEYWKWKNPEKMTKAQPTAGVVKTFTGNRDFETALERANKQVYIVRQSSLANAITYFTLTKETKASVDDIIVVAKEFEAYVFGKTEAKESPFEDMQSDEIPL